MQSQEFRNTSKDGVQGKGKQYTNTAALQELVGPLQTACSLGLQYPPLAKAALAALERWEGEQAQALIRVAPEIVPLLEPYLHEITDQATAPDDTPAQGKLEAML